MIELCADPQFGGEPGLSGPSTLPIGIECPLPLGHLPPLPEECKYAEIVGSCVPQFALFKEKENLDRRPVCQN
jgi:hypothetical protein